MEYFIIKIYIFLLVFRQSWLAMSFEFPFKEFFQIRGNTSVDIDNLKADFLCTVDKNNFFKVCSCEKNCLKYRNCCIDYLWNVNKTNQSLSKYVNMFLKEVELSKPQRCNALISQSLNNIKSKTIYMVSSCPNSSTNEVREQCLSTPIIPVFIRNDSIYKNKYCAHCWNQKSFEKVKLEAKCLAKNDNASEDASFFERFKDCTVSISENSDAVQLIRECADDANDRCNDTITDCRLCKAYTAGIKNEYDCFNNIHCMNENIRKNFWQSQYITPCLPMSADTGGFGYTIFTSSLPRYSITFSFDGNTGKMTSEECSKNEYYDKTLKSCISKITCPLGTNLINGECVQDIKDKPKTFENGVTYDDIISNCLNNNKYLEIHTNELSKAENKKIKSIINLHNKNIMYRDNMTILMNVQEYNAENLSKAISSLNYRLIYTSTKLYLTEFYRFDIRRNFPRAKLCSQPRKHLDFQVMNNCSVFLHQEQLLTKNFILIKEVDKKKFESISVYTCNEFHLAKLCPLREIDTFEKLANKTISVGNKKYKVNEYIPLRKGVGVCIDKIVSSKSERKGKIDVAGEIEGYLTVIGCILSILCYIWIIATYVIIVELRTIPGKNIVGLCCFLMFSDIIILLNIIPTKSTFFCKFLAVCLHFSSISVHCWTTVVAYEIWSTFHGKSMKNALRSQRRFTFYLIYALLAPATIIIICLSIDIAVTKIYGYMGICWITNKVARIVAFILIFLLCIVFAVSTLSYTLIQIYKQSKKSKKLLQKSGGETTSLSKMALKLILLLGVIEIFGLIQVKSNDDSAAVLNGIFRVLYSTVRSFRGVFIWLLYIVNRRVFNIYRGIRDRRSYRSSTRLTSMSRSASRRNKESVVLMESRASETCN